ncbi:MAG TPA: hypothetical protein VER96_33860 [Polyangiaceae bacterium]|nr:hypothetical protein [Polyangiaceae bacterium]
MATAQNELQQSSTAYRTAWTAAPANYDILANDPLKLNIPGLGAPAEGRPCRWIICGAVGTLVATGLDGVDVTLDVVFVGQRFDIQAIGLKNTSTAQKVSVYW